MNDKTADADRIMAGWQETIREVEANKDGFVEIPRKRIVTTPTQAMNDKTLTVTVVGRRCVYINDYRVAGSKPYVSENLPSWSFEADINDLRYAIGRRPSSANKALQSRIEAQAAEIERLQVEAKAQFDRGYYEGCANPIVRHDALREHLISALDTLKDAEVCDDNCGPCNEARAALGQSK